MAGTITVGELLSDPSSNNKITIGTGTTLDLVSGAGSVTLPPEATAAASLTGALPAISGAALTFLPSQGITNRQIWLLTTGLSLTGSSSFAYITANQSESTVAGYARLGDAMTVSSGVFTFPTTGIWAVDAIYQFSGGQGYARGEIHVTMDAGADGYSVVSRSAEGTVSVAGEYANLSISAQIDVTDVSNIKVKFTQGGTATALGGGVSIGQTSFTFTRIGDT